MSVLATSRLISVKNRVWHSLLALVISVVLASPVSLGSDFGTTGLIDIPTARMSSDGTLRFTSAYDGRHRSYMLTYQAVPWAQGTFRYTGFDEFFHWDRNYEFKLKIVNESKNLPQLAIGIRDALGTGLFESEYVVASKKLTNGLDFSLGLGWGRLAGNSSFENPLGSVTDGFKKRDATVGRGGKFSIKNFFSGPHVGLFGGMSYQFESIPLRAMIEYNPDEYSFDVSRGSRAPKSPISYGLTWEFSPGIRISASHQHMEDFGISVSAQVPSNVRSIKHRNRSFVSSVDLRSTDLPDQIKKNSWYDTLLYDVERSGLILSSARLSKDKNTAELVVGNTVYPLWTDAISQLTTLADLHLPDDVQAIHFVVEEAGHRTNRVLVRRPSNESNLNTRRSGSYEILPARSLAKPDHKTDFKTGKVNFTADLSTRFQLFDPDDPARGQLSMGIGADYILGSHWTIRARYGLDLKNNFWESKRKISNSRLPRVRSDIVKYLTQGETGLDSFYLEGRNTWRGNYHYRIFLGVLEEMYSGTGGELLFWPSKSRVALGLSANWVKQRDFDKSFDHLDYETTTLLGSAYWATPFHNYDLAVHVGRYLAKDIGGTFEARRTFDNGWQVGAWATFTNVSSDEFGEGSFDKGLYFKVPLDGLLGKSTRSSYSTRLRSIQRDGGQRLEKHSANIFWDLRQVRYDVFSNTNLRNP